MKYQHKELAFGRWTRLSFVEQMANIGAEVGRAINWRKKNENIHSIKAFERALELLELTIADKKNISRLKEICRVKEALVDYFAGDNIYASSDEKWNSYFYAFNYKARLNH